MSEKKQRKHVSGKRRLADYFLGVAILSCLLVAAVPWVLAAEKQAPAGTDWPRYRGADGTGCSTEKFTWPAAGAKELWRKSVGDGYSAAAIADGKLYTMGNDGKEDTVWCLNAATGKEIWKFSYKCPKGGGYPGPRCTPTVDGKFIYTMSRDGQIFCISVADGKEVWKKNAVKDFGSAIPQWGLSCSPLILDKSVIFDVGPTVALDKANGKLLWKVQTGITGYSSPMAFSFDKKKLVAVFPASGLQVLDPAAKGKVIAKFGWTTEYDINAAMPIISGNDIFISSGYGVGCALINLKTKKEVYRNEKMKNHTGTCVLVDGYLYGFDGQVGGGGKLTCMELKTGTVKWQQRGRLGTGALTFADGKLIIQAERGDLVIAEASPKGYTEIGKKKKAIAGQQCWVTPVLSGGKIYCRSERGDLVCLSVSGK